MWKGSMMKWTLLLLVIGGILFAGSIATLATADTDPALTPALKADLGESDLGKMTCASLEKIAARSADHIIFCRRSSPEVISEDGNSAVEFMRVKSNLGGKPFIVRVDWQKSIWWPADIEVVGQ